MIKKIKRGLFPIALAIICGGICGKLVCDIYVDSASSQLESTKVYLVQVGAYSTYDTMVSNTNVGNYVYYEDDDGLYKAIIGITAEYDNIEKIKSTYSGEVVVSEYYSFDLELNEEIEKLDLQMSELEDVSEIKEVVMEALALYKDKEEATLVKID